MAKAKQAKPAANSKKTAPAKGEKSVKSAKVAKSAGKPVVKAANAAPQPAKAGKTLKLKLKPKPTTKPAPAKAATHHKNPNGALPPKPAAPKVKVTLTPFLEKQKDRLLQLRDSLLDSMAGVAKDNLRARAEGSEASAFGMHQADAGSDAYDRDFALSLLSQEQDALYEIEEALKRIESGTYGVCEMSGKPIAHARLEALPFARYTVECQSQIEKQGKVTRARVPVTSLFGLTDEEGAANPKKKNRQPKPRNNPYPWPAISSSSNARRRKPKANPSRATSPRATRRARTLRTGSKRKSTTRI